MNANTSMTSDEIVSAIETAVHDDAELRFDTLLDDVFYGVPICIALYQRIDHVHIKPRGRCRPDHVERHRLDRIVRVERVVEHRRAR